MGAKAKPGSAIFTLGGSLMHERKPDFSGYATRAGVKCSDGRTILVDAFKHQDKTTVPLVWQHGHDDPENVLGHGVLENRADGVYVYGFFNDTPPGKQAKALVQHEDIKNLSIYANQLKQKALDVIHGMIREVSLVMAAANPGAFIDNVAVQHGDDIVHLTDEVVIYTDQELKHDDAAETPGTPKMPEPSKKEGENGKTAQEIYDEMSEDQQNVVHFMVGAAVEAATTTSTTAEHSVTHTDKKEGTWMSRNLFEEARKGGGNGTVEPEKHVLSHDAIKGIVSDAKRRGSLKAAVEDYALQHGIDNIDILFPDAKAAEATPDFDKRRTEWVRGVLGGTKHTPYARIKNFWADLTQDEARAKGYIKGALKKEEWIGVTKRSTGPSTVYKKQQLDRDDIIDITDFDVVVWLKGEMRLMLDEEIARAILIGDGRDVGDEDKIKDPVGAQDGLGIRSILNDHDLYAATVWIKNNATAAEQVDGIMSEMGVYKGSGSPTLYTTLAELNRMLLARDDMGRRLYRTRAELADELGVSNIVTVEVMEGEPGLIGIIVNLVDYNVGTDKGGDVTLFDDFDIDYNQYKYLIETRLSGALVKIRSAVIVRRADAGDTLVDPADPTFDGTDITIHDTAGVVYKRADTNAVVTSAAVVPVAAGTSLKIFAEPDATHYFADNVHDEWVFKNEA